MKKTFMTVLMTAVLSLALAAGAVTAQDQEHKVDLNRATIQELVELPGIGETVAARIVSYREENGGFRAPEELMNVRGIGEKTYLKLEPYLTVSKEMEEQ